MQLTELEPFAPEHFLEASSTLLVGFASSCVTGVCEARNIILFLHPSLELSAGRRFFGTACSWAQNIHWVITAKRGVSKSHVRSWNWWIEGLNFEKFLTAISYASYLTCFHRTISLFPKRSWWSLLHTTGPARAVSGFCCHCVVKPALVLQASPCLTVSCTRRVILHAPANEESLHRHGTLFVLRSSQMHLQQ